MNSEQLDKILNDFRTNHYADITIDDKPIGKITLEFNSIPMIELYKRRVPVSIMTLSKHGFTSLGDDSAIKCFDNTLEMEFWLRSHASDIVA